MGHIQTSTPKSTGQLIVRLAQTAADIEASQKLRFRVFYEELKAQADAATLAAKRDEDSFDAFCDHLLVVKTDSHDDAGIALPDGELVGTYRLLRQDVAAQNGGFYTAGEFDIAPLIARNSNVRFLELGRSCVIKAHRNKPIVELLWQGIWDYVRAHRLNVMFGCASLEGTDPEAYSDALSYLAHFAKPLPQWHAQALSERYVDMALKPPDSINQKRALQELPPLIKGYLRLGCSIGEGAIIDHQFNTLDVLIILPVAQINPRYFEKFGKPD